MERNMVLISILLSHHGFVQMFLVTVKNVSYIQSGNKFKLTPTGVSFKYIGIKVVMNRSRMHDYMDVESRINKFNCVVFNVLLDSKELLGSILGVNYIAKKYIMNIVRNCVSDCLKSLVNKIRFLVIIVLDLSLCVTSIVWNG
jgi:hypothetical protein